MLSIILQAAIQQTLHQFEIHFLQFSLIQPQLNQKSFQPNNKQKMFGRNKIDPFDTVNMCNQFLIVHLMKKVQTFQSRGLGKNAIVYKNAIYSIKRYPLPIICKAQLQSINGIGEFLSQDLEKVIKKHYSAFLDQNLQEKNKEKQQTQEPEASRSLVNNSQNSKQVQQNSQDSQNGSQTTKGGSVQYKPRVNTANSYFLQALRKLFSQDQHLKHTGVSKQDLQQEVQSKFPSAKNKAWKGIQDTLQSNGYILIEKQLIGLKRISYKLTQKGEEYAKSMDEKTRTHSTKSKILHQVKVFKEEIMSKKSTVSVKSSGNTLEGYCTNTMDAQMNAQEEQEEEEKFVPKPLLLTQDEISFDKLALVIDNREKKQKSEQINFFNEKMTKKYKIQCKNSSLSLGDFLWVYDNKVLDYVIERKKADDLVASILDGRYKDQKYRLKNCGATNIFYIYQGHPSTNGNGILTTKQLNSALIKTRTKENFKVYKTKDVGETMNLLHTFHNDIFKKIKSNKARYLCTLEEFIEFNSIHKNLTVGHAFALGLMTIPAVGKSAVKVIRQYFRTFKQMHSQLKKFESNEERVEFLKNLFKGTGITQTLPRILIDLLFLKNYAASSSKEQQQQKNDSTSITQSLNVFRSQVIMQREIQMKSNSGIDKKSRKRFSVIKEEEWCEEDGQEEREYQI